jgi:hypothetical protein
MSRWPIGYFTLAICCASGEGGNAEFAVTVTADTVAVATRGPAEAPWIEFELPVSIRNTGSTLLYDAVCATRVDKQVGEQWRRVWEPACALGSGTLNGLRPGEVRFERFKVTGSIGTTASQWVGPVEGGPYRFAIGFLRLPSDPTAASLGILVRHSNGFQLQVPPVQPPTNGQQ